MQTTEHTPRALLVLTNLPDEASAEALATALVETRLAACVNRLAPCHSVYRWQGNIERAMEIPLLIKTDSARYPWLRAGDTAGLIAQLHQLIAHKPERHHLREQNPGIMRHLAQIGG